MSTEKIEGAIWAMKFSWESEYTFRFSSVKDPESRHMRKDGSIFIAPYTIEIEVDGDVQAMLHKKAIKSLQRERRLILAENEKRLNEIDDRIKNLLAIEHKQEVAA